MICPIKCDLSPVRNVVVHKRETRVRSQMNISVTSWMWYQNDRHAWLKGLLLAGCFALRHRGHARTTTSLTLQLQNFPSEICLFWEEVKCQTHRLHIQSDPGTLQIPPRGGVGGETSIFGTLQFSVLTQMCDRKCMFSTVLGSKSQSRQNSSFVRATFTH